VDTDYYSSDNVQEIQKNDRFTFLMIARLIADKGVREFVRAAQLLAHQGHTATFQLMGAANVCNRTAISDDELAQWQEEGLIEYLGEVDDVRPLLSAANCFVLPSYREGLSMALLEASSMGLPMITTDVPGCRDIVENGVNGLLCKSGDYVDLARAMLDMCALTHKQREDMGAEARKRAIHFYDQSIVNRIYHEQLDKILEK
jgi:glycosyltransferase involved in cell wall biosynthesis